MADGTTDATRPDPAEEALPRRRAILFIVLLGVTATTIGIVAGFGELMGYGARLVSGYLGDRTGRYWAVTIVGYLLNLFAVPLLALAGAWQIAVVLIIA